MSSTKTTTKFAVPEMPFDQFTQEVVKHWTAAWKNTGRPDYQKYVDMITENPTGKPEGELQHVKYAYDMYLYNWDIFHGVRTGEDAKVRTEVSVPWEGTNLTVELNEVGMRVLKTCFGTWENFNSNVEDYNIPYLFTLLDHENKPRVDFFHAQEGGMEISTLALTFGSYIFCEQVWPVLDTLTATEVLDQKLIQNQEQRGMCLTIPAVALGLKKILKKIDTYVDKRDENNVSVYSLFTSEKGFLGLAEPCAYVACTCPSTGREFMLSCKNEYKNAKDAVASLLMIPKDLIGNVTQVSRQGEVFMTLFDIPTESKEFKEKIKSERVPVKGDWYFEKLVYES